MPVLQGISAEIALVGIFHWHYHLNIEILYFYGKYFPGTAITLESILKTQIKVSTKLTESEQESCTSIFRNVMRLRQKLSATASEVAKSRELHTSEMSLIDTLGKYGPLTMGKLAALSFSSPANATYTVQSLEQRKLLKRQRSPDSQRVVDVHLTPQGVKIFKLTYPRTTEAVNQLINGRLTKQERKIFDKLLEKLAG